MNKIYTLLMALIIGLIATSCDKDEPGVYDYQAVLEREAPLLSAYITAQGLSDSAKFHQETGIWYVLTDSGDVAVNYLDSAATSDKAPIKNMLVQVRYTGRLLDSTIFEQNTAADSIPYVSLLPSETEAGQSEAWKVAFYPKLVGGFFEEGLKKGAKIRIITPSIFGYQNRSHGIIKENSPLDYELEVLDIKEPVKTD
jgi:FKBP-type peptidyl-prolyl cis-trans isomerase